ncbi:hypothetical protein IV203_038806 [Nitzschia inconspicua]|uniref:Uncharacterized protein n=1 Tax=Nitzschia inconspicua TaxID=303405 RepID=A0A9K3LNS5_9STRA|nr:hypothetical protein IV203_004926 [Nitzschia inconspicua]KAG7362333.1 hypothetical protein IV203_025217 [Nitzschia inconspicua]KAG7365602.1 hypothetical protein IV203_038806 [Nitzschia inconspicua]
MSFGSSSTSSSLLTASTWGDKIVSLILFYGSYLFLGKIRSIGVSNLPMAIRLLISMMGKKSNSLTNSKGKDNVTSEMSCSNHKTDDKIRTVGSTTTNATNNLTNPSSWDDVCHKVWTYLQASSVVSGLFNIYPYVIIKWNAMFHIVLVVKESMEHRYATQLEHQRIIREREEKRQRMLDFWRRWLPRFLFEWIFLRKQRKTTKQQNNDKGDDEAATPASPVKAGTSMSTSTSTSTGKRFVGLRKRNKEMPAAETICTKTSSSSIEATSLSSTTTTSSSSSISPPFIKEEIRQHVQKAKLVVQGHRESNMDDIIWGFLQIAFIYNDWTHWQTCVVAWLVFLLTVLEEAVLDPSLSSKQKWRKAVWIGAMAAGSGKLAFFF